MKKKKFIKKAIYPGGINQLRKFIKDNLIYPKEALTHNIEGNVLLKYKVNSLGKTKIFDHMGSALQNHVNFLGKTNLLGHPRLPSQTVHFQTT